MKRIAYVGWGGVILVALLASLAGAQSEPALGDYAREVRKEKGQKAPAARQFDNDNLPRQEHISVVGSAPPAPQAGPQSESQAEAAAQAGDQAQNQAQQKPEAKAADDDEAAQRQKFYEDWQKKIAAQKEQIDLLTRELAVAQKEYQLRAAAFYADAGNRLRNSAQWDKEDREFKEQIASKKKALDEAKQKLEDMQEQARKAGLPLKMRE